MPDYKAMYYHLFNAMTDAVETIQKAQQEAEEQFLKGDDTIRPLWVMEEKTEETPEPPVKQNAGNA